MHQQMMQMEERISSRLDHQLQANEQRFLAIEETQSKQQQQLDFFFPNAHIDIRKWRNESHDRFLIIDDALYHCGHSLNANGGHRISAITRMGTSPETILSQM